MILLVVRNDFVKARPSRLSDSLYVNSPTLRKAAKARVKAARKGNFVVIRSLEVAKESQEVGAE